MTSTVLVLVLVPTFYLLYARMFGVTVDSVTAAEAAVVAKPELLVQQASV
jgi:hypothetical protein